MRIAQATTILLLSVVSALMAGPASAQSTGAPRVEISVLPGGATIFTEDDGGAPAFGAYALAGSVTVNANRFVGIEGEVGGNIGIDQDYRFIPVAAKDDAPAFFGRETRYGHRIAGGLVINLSR